MVAWPHPFGAFESMALRGLLVAALALPLAAPAFANSPAPPCGWLVEEERFWEPSDPKNTASDDESTYYIVEGAWPTMEANDFVSFSIEAWSEREFSWNLGLQHCPSGKGMLISTSPETSMEIRAAFRGILASDATFSMRDIAREMRKMGARVKMRAGGLGTCGCEKAETKF
jgi:hypothetical protein